MASVDGSFNQTDVACFVRRKVVELDWPRYFCQDRTLLRAQEGIPAPPTSCSVGLKLYELDSLVTYSPEALLNSGKKDSSCLGAGFAGRDRAESGISKLVVEQLAIRGLEGLVPSCCRHLDRLSALNGHLPDFQLPGAGRVEI